ncbi:MAG: MBL fold metallo-hydrolase [Oscillospiraceae bacterium]|jgi:glyoxylase-like metal-dependent hydrolase (beta-lactamase superfamily II)|nr:MBL fold metallo-hydrolase [Oscillospiraceae bacterium]
MLIKTFVVGMIQTNCYIVTDEQTLQCAVIDPGAESGTILNYIDDNGLKLSAVFITHGHSDHIMAVEELVFEKPAPVFVSALDDADLRGVPTLRHYGDGDKVSVGNLVFTVIATPGHTRGGVCLRCEDALFTGDTLFRDSVGRTDFEGGDMNVLLESLRKLYRLKGDFEVYPGHAESTTLDEERRMNYYMKYAIERA